jgi:ATP-binding cassette, subfamily F, member 3
MINFNNISKSFGTQMVLDDATFRINAGEHVGIVGPNGAGKSTIFDLLTGEITPDSGTIECPKGIKVAYMRQQPEEPKDKTSLICFTENAMPEIQKIEQEMEKLEADLSNEKNLWRHGELQIKFEELGGYTLRHKAEAALTGLGFKPEEMHRSFDEFSGGWQMRAELARTIISNPEILLLDEPSNYLDIPAVEWLQKFLNNFQGTLLLISHDRYLLNTLTSKTLEVANTQTEKYPGNYDFYAKARVEKQQQTEAQLDKQAKVIDKTERFIERFRSKNTKATQVQSKIKMLEKMDQVTGPAKIRSKGNIRLQNPPDCGHEIVRLDDASFAYDGDNYILENINLRITKGEKIALIGLNGRGKTTLLKMLAGNVPLSKGKRVCGPRVVSGYQSQEIADTIAPSETVFSAVKSMAYEVPDQVIRKTLGSFGFSGDAIEKNVTVLSGGEKIRLAFARLLIKPPNFLLLDEPTTHLDIQTRENLEKALKEFSGTVCIVSHDVEFIKHVAKTVIEMIPPSIKPYAGNYEYFCRKKQMQEQDIDKNSDEDEEEKQTVDKKKLRRLRAQQREDTKHLTQIIKNAEKKIELHEAEKEKIHDLMAKGGDINYQELNIKLHELQTKIDNYTQLWENAFIEIEIAENS